MADRRPRPRAGLTREKILDAAIVFVDEHGPAALSTRRLGAALGVEGMTLYHYLPNKAALLDGMVERILEQAAADTGAAADTPWTDTVRRITGNLRAALLQHPGVLGIIATRPVNSPSALAILESGLSALVAQGVPLDLAMDVLNAGVTFTIGHTLAEAGTTPGQEEAAAAVTAPADPTRYPNVSRALASGAGLDFDRRFTRTLDMIIDGYAALAAVEAKPEQVTARSAG